MKGATVRPHWVYRHMDVSGDVIYVGYTVSPEQREMNHKRRAPWWADVAEITYDGPYSRTEAQRIERQLIGDLQPVNNLISNPGAPAQPSVRLFMPEIFREFRANHSGHDGACPPNCWDIAKSVVFERLGVSA